MLNIWKKYHPIRPNILCPHISFQDKTIFFVSHVKIQILMLQTRLFMGLFLYFLRGSHKMFFPKNLCRNIVCLNIHAIFCFEFFDISKFIFNIFFIIGSYIPESPINTFSFHVLYIMVTSRTIDAFHSNTTPLKAVFG
jgi:hypothetical protein